MKPLQIGSSTFKWGSQTYIMGIINITPDSFSGDGLFNHSKWVERAVEQARNFAQEGADIIDVGGESTRPGSEPLSAKAEMERVLPVIEAITKEVELPISIDTYKAEVAAAAIEAGAVMVNDVWGLQKDEGIAPLCASKNIPLIIMHNRSQSCNAVQEERLGGRYVGSQYDNLLTDIEKGLQHSVDIAKKAGLPDSHIIIDPGIGFGKTVEQNLMIMNKLDNFKKLGYPILLGTSNKSFIGYTLNLPPNERMEGTMTTITIGIAKGADIIRVHNVKVMSRVARMTDAILRTVSL